MKQTAVEWLEKELKERYPLINSEPLFEQAKEMEKEQIINSYNQGKEDGYSIGFFYNESEFADNEFENAEQYYNNKYKNTNK
jgi:hypothetical protein